MAGFSFSSFNKTRTFDFNSEGYEYISVEEAAVKYNDIATVPVLGIGINKTTADTAIYPENAWVATPEEFINVPHHQIEEVRAMLENPAAIRLIKAGKLGVTFESYSNKFGDFKKIIWCDC